MALPRYETLDTVRELVWERLEMAAQDPGHAFRTLTFGTVEANAPALRTVVLRAASAEDRQLQFHTDRRSGKVEALRDNPQVAWHGWDPESAQQIRLSGTATVHLHDEVATALWEHESPASLDLYVCPPSPGTPIDEPDDRLRPAVKSDPITEDDVADGWQYFAAIRTVVDEIEWLHLHPDGHYRAQFAYQPDQEAFEGSWVDP